MGRLGREVGTGRDADRRDAGALDQRVLLAALVGPVVPAEAAAYLHPGSLFWKVGPGTGPSGDNLSRETEHGRVEHAAGDEVPADDDAVFGQARLGDDKANQRDRPAVPPVRIRMGGDGA